jgi:hypothetical protein
MSGKTGKGKATPTKAIVVAARSDYGPLLTGISSLLEQARRGVARAANAIMTATYWEVGRRIVEHEQGGKARAEYGEELLARLSVDLTTRYGRGFSRPGLQRMRSFYLGWEICSTPSSKLEARAKCSALSSKSEILQTPSAQLAGASLRKEIAATQQALETRRSAEAKGLTRRRRDTETRGPR